MQRDDSVVPITGLENEQNVPVDVNGVSVHSQNVSGANEGVSTENESKRHAAGTHSKFSVEY